jgi:hypothetical protein
MASELLPNEVPNEVEEPELQEEEPTEVVPEAEGQPLMSKLKAKGKYPAEPKKGVEAQIFEVTFEAEDKPLGADFAWTIPPEIVAVDLLGSAREKQIRIDDKLLGVNGVDAANLSRDDIVPLLAARPLTLRILRGNLPKRDLHVAYSDLLPTLPPKQPDAPAPAAPPEHIAGAVTIQRFVRGRFVRRNFHKYLEKGGVSAKFQARFAEGRAEETAVLTMMAGGAREKAERINHNREK